MALALPPDDCLAVSEDTEQMGRALVLARRAYYEDPAKALAVALRCHEIACSKGDPGLRARALALQGIVSVHRGDLRGALALAVEAEGHAAATDSVEARAEVAALKAQMNFFTGSYAEALGQAQLAVDLADRSGDTELRIFARRNTCMVFGNVGAADLRERLVDQLQLTIDAGNHWEQAISHNDMACYLQEAGDIAGAEQAMADAFLVADALPDDNTFLRGVLHSTRADVALLSGRAAEALADAERALTLLTSGDEPNPYVVGVTLRAEVQARMQLGHFDDAQRTGEGALSWLGDRVPQTRSLILSTLAEALREAGRVDEAYEALAHSSQIEREAFRELSELQRSLERATLQALAARRESDSLAAKNRQLAEAHAELERRTRQLEGLQDQLRDQAERDWLTGLHNRRFLARELERLSRERRLGPISVAVLDLDHFKSVNDRYGHQTGDQVLVRVARLLCDVLRDTDTVVRSGGEEFLLLMPLTDAHAAAQCCERICERLHTETWDGIVADITVTASVGLASSQDPGHLEALVRLADDRLYEAKRRGRDRVVTGQTRPQAA